MHLEETLHFTEQSKFTFRMASLCQTLSSK